MHEIPRLLQLCFDPAYDNTALRWKIFSIFSVCLQPICVFKKLFYYQHNYVQFLCEIFVLKSTTRFHWLVEFQSIKLHRRHIYVFLSDFPNYHHHLFFWKKKVLFVFLKRKFCRYQRKVNIGLNIIAITVKKICFDNFWHMPVWPKFILTHTYDSVVAVLRF